MQVHCRRHINTDINRLLRRHATSTTTTPSTHHSNTSTRQCNQSTSRTSQPSSPFRPAPVGNRYLPRAGTSCQNNFTVTAVFLLYRGVHTLTSPRSLPPASSTPTRGCWNVSTDDSGTGVPTPWDSTTTVTEGFKSASIHTGSTVNSSTRHLFINDNRQLFCVL